MSTQLGVVLLGYGLAGRVFHGPLLAATPDVQVRAVVTTDPGRRAQALEDFPEAIVLERFEDAWELDDIELAVIATANVSHVPLALEAIDRGLHVVIDKPLAPTAGRAEAIIDAAAEMGVGVHPFQNRRWDADFLTVRHAVASGDLGMPHRYESRIERMRPLPRGSWRESADPEQMGGVLYDFGAHLVDQALEVMGPATAVQAHARSVRDPEGADDDVVITLAHANGGISILVGSMIAAFAEPSFRVLGTRGGIRVDIADAQEAALRAGLIPRDATWGLQEGIAALVAVDGEEVKRTDLPLARGRWDLFYPAVRDAVLHDAAPPVQAQDAVENLRVLDAARASALTGVDVPLDPPAGHAA